MDAKLLYIVIPAKLENINSKDKAFYEGFSLYTEERVCCLIFKLVAQSPKIFIILKIPKRCKSYKNIGFISQI